MASASISARVTGGWRVRISGVWYAFPVTLDILNPPPPPGNCQSSIEWPTISAMDTYSANVTAGCEAESTVTDLGLFQCDPCPPGQRAVVPATVRLTRLYSRQSCFSSNVRLLPDLMKSVVRVNEDGYGAVIRRYGFPWAKARASSSCCQMFWQDCIPPPENCPEMVWIDEVRNREYGQDTRAVGNDIHPIEEVFGETTYAPYAVSSDFREVFDLQIEEVLPGACEVDPKGNRTWPTCCFDDMRYKKLRTAYSGFPVVQMRTGDEGNPDMLFFLDHDYDEARYVNYSANPHWSFIYFFPDDNDSEFWKVYGVKRASADYWIKIREQYFDHSTMPSFERTKQRNHIVEAPLSEGALAEWIAENIAGVRVFTSWWGISRFKAQALNPDVSESPGQAQGGLWSSVNCTLSFTPTGIQVTPNAGATSCRVEMDLGSFALYPFLYPHIAQRIGVGWAGANITSAVARLVSVGGASVVLGNVPGIYARQNFDDPSYAGTWAQDFGAGVVTDTGADIATGGTSASAMGSPERVVALLILTGRSADRLRFDFTVSNQNAFMLEYPVFYAPTNEAQVIYETGQSQDLLWADGPGIRFGQWDVWNDIGGSLQDPQVRPFGEKMSVLDYLVWKRLVIEARAKDDGLNSEIASLYDSREGQLRGDVAYDTVALIVDGGVGAIAKYGWLVNSLAEVPPLCQLPRGMRNAQWAETTTWAQVAYSLVQRPRRIVNSAYVLDMYDDETPSQKWTSEIAGIVAGWKVAEHDRAVTNNEGDDFLFVRGGGSVSTIARGSPWHGYFAMVDFPEQIAGQVSSDVSLNWRHIRAFIRNGTIWIGWRDNLLDSSWQDFDTGIGAVWCSVVFDRSRNSRVLLAYEDKGTVYLRASSDDGVNWGVPINVAPGKKPAHRVHLNGLHFLYWIDGVQIKGLIRDVQGNVLDGPFVAIASGVDDEGISVDLYHEGGGGFRVALHWVSGGNIMYATSKDGKAFS